MGRAGAAATAAHRSRLAASLPLAQVLWPHGGTHLEVGPCPTIEEAQMISDALAGAMHTHLIFQALLLAPGTRPAVGGSAVPIFPKVRPFPQ